MKMAGTAFAGAVAGRTGIAVILIERGGKASMPYCVDRIQVSVGAAARAQGAHHVGM